MCCCPPLSTNLKLPLMVMISFNAIFKWRLFTTAFFEYILTHTLPFFAARCKMGSFSVFRNCCFMLSSIWRISSSNALIYHMRYSFQYTYNKFYLSAPQNDMWSAKKEAIYNTLFTKYTTKAIFFLNLSIFFIFFKLNTRKIFDY